MDLNIVRCKGCGNLTVIGTDCEECGSARESSTGLRTLISEPTQEMEKLIGKSPKATLGPAERATMSFLFACKIAIWVGILTVSTIMLFFIGVVFVAIRQSM